MYPFLSLNKYNLNTFIYSYNDPGENVYLLLRGEIGLYKLIESEEMFSSEEYYFYLYNQYNTYKQLITENNQGNKINILDINDFIDIDILISNAHRNNQIFPLYSIDDIGDLNKIILSVKLYVQFLENKKGNLLELYRKFELPLDYLNCDKFLKEQISINNFMEELSKNIRDREKFYMKYLGKDEKYIVRIHKFVKYENLKEYSYFGNFELIDSKPLRKEYAISENDSTILLSINKKEYNKKVNKSQKERRKKEIDFFHNNFFFKTVSRAYFESNIFIKFKIDNFFRDHILSNQDEKMNNFIFIEEGIIKSSIDDISILEFQQKIKTLYDFIIKKSKEYNIDQKTLIDFDIQLNNKTNLKYELIEGALKQKQNFTISKTEKGTIGDYEYFFNVPSFITSTVVSKNNRIFFYDFKNFKKVNDETHAFNENLKKISFYKLKSILKRMISIYNSYFSFTMKIIEDKLVDKEIEDKEYSIKDKENAVNKNDSSENGKNYISPINIFRNKKINMNKFINTINESYISKNNNDRRTFKNKNNLNNLFTQTNLNEKTLYNIKHFHNINNFENRNNKSMFCRRIIGNNKQTSIFHSIKILFKDHNGRKSNKNLKIKNEEKMQINKLFHNKPIIDNDNLKHKKQSKNKILKIFLPPLSDNTKIYKPITETRKTNVDKYLTRHALHTLNSINNVSLGHTDKNNIEEYTLTNSNYKKSKKSKSINIKRAQIIVLRNRDKRAKLLLKMKNDFKYFIDEETF